ncbi:MAG: DUF6680 family protein [Pseudomonadota bacterium]
MSIADWLIITAVILGPILAVQAQKILETMREKNNRRLWVFKTLMATRGQPLNPLHVEALNMIDIEFYGKDKKDKKIIEKWREYLDHLASMPQDQKDKSYDANFARWKQKNQDYLMELLNEMSRALGYKFDNVTLKKGIYVPRGHNELENDQYYLRKLLIGVMLGQQAIPIEIREQEKPSIPEQSGAKQNM